MNAMKTMGIGVSVLALLLGTASGGAAEDQRSPSDKARAEGFEDQVEAEREDHVREALDAARKRATPTPEATPLR